MIHLIILILIILFRTILVILFYTKKSYNDLIVLIAYIFYQILKDYAKNDVYRNGTSERFQRTFTNFMKELKFVFCIRKKRFQQQADIVEKLRFAFASMYASLNYIWDISTGSFYLQKFLSLSKFYENSYIRLFFIIPYLNKYNITLELLTKAILLCDYFFSIYVVCWIIYPIVKKHLKK